MDNIQAIGIESCGYLCQEARSAAFLTQTATLKITSHLKLSVHETSEMQRVFAFIVGNDTRLWK